MRPILRTFPYLLICTLLVLGQTAREKRVVPVDSTQRQSFERQPKVAVLAGVGHYATRSGLTQLRYPAHDVELMEAELTKQGYKVVTLKDQEATRGSIEQALHDAAELVDRGSGTVLFFFSGHGFADQGANYLATYEASANNLSGSGMAVKQVEQLLKGTGAPRQVMFIDACRNETGGKGGGTRSFANLQGAAGLRALLSTKAGHISYEDDSLGSGVFTHFLVEGLQGQAAGNDGLITFRDLADYVTDGVSTYGFKKGQMQVPYEAGEASGDFLLARATEMATIAPLPAPVAAPVHAPTPAPRVQQGPEAGSTKVNLKDGQKYVWIPAGSFYMGCSPGDTECDADEKPAHNVSITKGFWLGETPVTQAAYLRVMGTNPSYFKGDDLPVEQVSWGEAKSYCEAIGGRLPTEAEWEYAARAGTVGARYGNIDAIAWYDGNSRNEFHPVARKQPNTWGLYDMLGNVWQWTADWYDEKYFARRDATDPQGPSLGTVRTLRGGSWSDSPRIVRVSDRYGSGPGYRGSIVGARCVE
jgi:formylglycine-generating enzyme required for sulfatase activity